MIDKQCTMCRRVKSIGAFGLAKDLPDGHKRQCKDCLNRKSREQYRASAARRRNVYEARMARTYGIAPERYQAMLADQGVLCAICQRRSKTRLAVDHDHSCCDGKTSCGKCVRGLLCKRCNYVLLGRICQENTRGRAHAIATLRRATDYLERTD